MKKLVFAMALVFSSVSFGNVENTTGKCVFINEKGRVVIDDDRCQISGGVSGTGPVFADVVSGKNKISVVFLENGKAEMNGVAARYTDTKELSIIRTLNNEILIIPNTVR